MHLFTRALSKSQTFQILSKSSDTPEEEVLEEDMLSIKDCESVTTAG
jgi:hypothetical protein